MVAKTEKPAADAAATEEDKNDPKPKLVEVIAKKAFLGPNGWVQIGEKPKVTPDRKRELARNGLIEGPASDREAGQTSTPLGAARDSSRRLTVGSAQAEA